MRISHVLFLLHGLYLCHGYVVVTSAGWYAFGGYKIEVETVREVNNKRRNLDGRANWRCMNVMCVTRWTALCAWSLWEVFRAQRQCSDMSNLPSFLTKYSSKVPIWAAAIRRFTPTYQTYNTSLSCSYIVSFSIHFYIEKEMQPLVSHPLIFLHFWFATLLRRMSVLARGSRSYGRVLRQSSPPPG